MQRFFISDPLEDIYTITDISWIHQLSRVLRGRIGDEVFLFRKDGSERKYSIHSLEKKKIILEAIEDITFHSIQQKNTLTLYQSIPNKWEKCEYIIQKSVEIGVSKIVFFRSERSQQVIPEKKKARWSEIAKEALEQCGGYLPLHIEYKESFEEIEIEKYTKNIILHTTGNLSSVEKIYDVNTKKYGLWIGPEGGWSDKEIEKMDKNSFIFARFGKRILRTETAGIVVAFSLLCGFE